MTIRSKCKLCESIIKAKEGDIVSCSCGELTLNGILKTVVCIKSTENYMEVDDLGNEITEPRMSAVSDSPKPVIKDLLKLFDEMIESVERLPAAGMMSSINHYDYLSLLFLIRSSFESLSEDSCSRKGTTEESK